ncbi:PAS domain S-box protein [Candidatus Nitrospira bockiana]
MTTEPVDARRPSVLIVDDDPDICFALSDFLEHAGYAVQAVGTARAALSRADEARFGAVILDLGLPDGDGADVLRALTTRQPNLPVIILTAFTSEERTVGLLRQGAYAFLTKPYNRDQLKATLARAVGASELASKAERIERALNDSERRLQSVMESATDAIILADPHGSVTAWNPAAQRLFGYPAEQIIGRPLTVLLPARYHGAYRVDDLTTPTDSTVIGRTVELHGRRCDGSEFPAELSLGLWKGSDGLFYSAIIRDVTERKEAQARLEESEARLRLALTAANMGIWDWDVATDRVTWSEDVFGLFGISPDAFGGTSAAFLGLVHSDDRSAVHRHLRLAVEEGAPYDVEHRIVRSDGEVRWLGCKGRALRDPEGRPVRLLGTVQDITARKRAEVQLLQQQIEQQVLLDLIPAMVWFKDCHNRIIRANRLAAESINRPIAEVEGRSTYELYPEEAEQYYQDDLAVIRGGAPKLGIVEQYQGASGVKRWVQTDKVPYRDPKGRVVGVLVFAQDITARRQAEEALLESEARFRAFMDHSPVLAFMKDEDLRYVYANRQWERHTQLTSAQWSGKTDEDLLPPDLAAACGASDRLVLELGRVTESIETEPRSDGTARQWLVVKFPIHGGTGQRYIGGIVQALPDGSRAGPED